MSGFLVRYDALGAVAGELERCAEETALVVPRLVVGLARAGVELLPLAGVFTGAAILAEVGRCCGPAGAAGVAAGLGGVALQLRTASFAYQAAEATAGAALRATEDTLTIAAKLTAPLRAIALVVAWNTEHRDVPPPLRPYTDRLLGVLDLTVEGPAKLSSLSDAAAVRLGIDPVVVGAAADSPAEALSAVEALGSPSAPGTFAVVETSAGPPPRFVVCLPGLEHWMGTDGSGADLPGAIATLTGHSSYISAVGQALRSLPRGSKVLLVGHSQGGMVAEALAADRGLRARGVDVSGLLTAGSPRLGDNPLAGVRYLALENAADPVPPLRLLAAGVPLPPIPEPDDPDRTVVRFPATHSGLTIANHQLRAGGYIDVAASDDPAVQAFRDWARPFFTGVAVRTRLFEARDASW